MKKDMYAYINQNKSAIVMSMSDKTGFKSKNLTKD